MPDADLRLLADLDAFYTEHRRCGDLDAGVEGLTVWFSCECGATWPGQPARTTMPADELDARGRRLRAALAPVLVPGNRAELGSCRVAQGLRGGQRAA